MKHMKKVCGLLLALAMALSLTVTAFADELGSITINGVSADNTYEIYRLLDLESYNTESGAYNYTINSDWAAFFTAGTGALDYFSIENGYVSWKAATDDDTVAAFAKLALAYAKTSGIEPVQTTDKIVDGQPASDMSITGTTGVFSNLPLGYYLIDSTVGALCGLTTTNPNVSINAKNVSPTIDKQVQEDSTGNWGSFNSADIGQTVEFRTTIYVHDGAQNYVLHDKMTEGLTFKEVSKIEHVIPGTPNTVTEVPNTYYTVVTADLTDD